VTVKATLVDGGPVELVVLNCWVTLTNGTPALSSASTILAKSGRKRVRRSTL